MTIVHQWVALLINLLVHCQKGRGKQVTRSPAPDKAAGQGKDLGHGLIDDLSGNSVVEEVDLPRALISHV